MRPILPVSACVLLPAVLAAQHPAKNCDPADAPSGATVTCADSQAMSRLKYGSSFSVFFEEDNLQLQIGNTHTDRNYTLGLGLQWSGEIEKRGRDKPLRWLNRRLGLDSVSNDPAASETGMLSGTAFSPSDIGSPLPVIGDRPWAFLLGWTVRRTQPNESGAWSTDLTLGTIGSPIGQWVQRGIHYTSRHLSGSATPVNPQGWPNQLFDSPLGAPTARYGLTYERVLVQQTGGRTLSLLSGTAPKPSSLHHFEIAGSVGGQAGYYTEADAGGTIRVGRFSVPFWQFKGNPLGIASRKAVVGGGSNEFFLFGTDMGRAVLFNALLTGYGDNRFTNYRLTQSEVQHWINEYTYGVSFGHVRPDGSNWMVTWIMDSYRSHEFNTVELYERGHHWGGVFFSRSAP